MYFDVGLPDKMPGCCNVKKSGCRNRSQITKIFLNEKCWASRPQLPKFQMPLNLTHISTLMASRHLLPTYTNYEFVFTMNGHFINMLHERYTSFAVLHRQLGRKSLFLYTKSPCCQYIWSVVSRQGVTPEVGTKVQENVSLSCCS